MTAAVTPDGPVRLHAFRDDALGSLDATGVAERIRTGEASRAEVLEAAIARMHDVAPSLGALALDLADAARTAEPGADGVFAGVPTVMKDNAAVSGAPTQHGTDAFVAKPEAEDGALTRLMRSTGASIIGKSALSEFGFSPVAEHPSAPPVRNPWDPRRSSGASSAGSGALVAAGAVPFAHGNDGGGSIRIPSAACGLVGLKPSRGRGPQNPTSSMLPVAIVSDGVLTRSVRDTAAWLHAADAFEPHPRMPRLDLVRGPSTRRLRIGLMTRSRTHRPSRRTADELLRVAHDLQSLGHTVVEVDRVEYDGFADDFVLYWGLLAVLEMRFDARLHRRTWDPARLDDLTVGLAHHARRRLASVPGAVARLRRSTARAARLYEQVDVVLSPTVGHETPLVGDLDPMQPFDELLQKMLAYVIVTPLQNADGTPAVSLPLATADDGTPTGMMFSAAHGDERTLLELAFELEEAFPWRRITG